MFQQLWFDVENKRYTTERGRSNTVCCCGLMQKTKDIQQYKNKYGWYYCCGLMQKTKDIQLGVSINYEKIVVV